VPTSQHSQIVARDLDSTFSVPRMKRVWRDHVRTGLRRQPLSDLHDFLDVHRNLKPFLQVLRSEVLGGNYRASIPETVLLEKRDGIPRRLSLPAPADAILLQTIVEILEKAIAAAQPHPNAYYSQSHAPPSPEDVDGTFAYPWWILWPQFQKRIWGFTAACDFVVVTDLANYFDCIPLSKLRNRIVSFGAFNETVIDFLFFLLDAFTWRPFYMPQSGVGLPQINFDAPRLLAHAYLFPIDQELQRSTNGNFVRWMDDINCGVQSANDARKLLRGLEIVLNSLGIRLNTAKTTILPAQEALTHFWISENRAITLVTNLVRGAIVGSTNPVRYRAYARKRYRSFYRRSRVGQWEKVCKRYFTLFSLLGDAYLERTVPEILNNIPALRGSICRYYALIGPSTRRVQHLGDFLRSGRCLDDASLFEVVRTLIAWRGQTRGSRKDAIISLIPTISMLGSETIASSQSTVSGVSSAVWLLSKYGSSDQLSSFLHSSEPIWTRSSWAARQVAAATPLLQETEQTEIRRRIVRSGMVEALRVLANLDQLAQISVLDNQLRKYLLHTPSVHRPYPLEKVIIARVLLRSQLPSMDHLDLRNRLIALLRDPCYVSLLRRK